MYHDTIMPVISEFCQGNICHKAYIKYAGIDQQESMHNMVSTYVGWEIKMAVAKRELHILRP